MICWARYLFIGVVAVLGIGQMVAACGQKGDLYLPDPEQESKEQSAADKQAEKNQRAQSGDEPADEDKASDIPLAPASEEPAPRDPDKAQQ